MKKLIQIILGITTYSLIILIFSAYDHEKTHLEINHISTVKFLERYTQSNFADGKFKNYIFNWNNSSAPNLSGPALDKDYYLSYNTANEPLKSMNPISWITQGGWMEDNPWATAAIRHFYDPLAIDNGKKYLTDRSSLWESLLSPVSSAFTQDAETWVYDHVDNKYSFKKAKEYFINALKETNTAKKNEYMALAYRSLGQVLHLIADMGCPPHVRNDSHPPNFYASDALSEGLNLIKVMGDPDPYEDLVKTMSVQSLVESNSPNSNLTNQFSKAETFKEIFEKLAYFTNQRFVTNQTISTFYYKQTIRPDNPYPQPIISESEYVKDEYTYYKIYDGVKVKMCKDKTPILFGTSYGRGKPYVDFDCVKSQASAIFPNIVEASVNVIRQFIPSLKIEITKAITDSGGIVSGKISYTIPSLNDEYSGMFDLSNIYNGPIKLKINSNEVNINTNAIKNNFEIKLNGALSNLKQGDKAEAYFDIGGIIIKSDQVEFLGNLPQIISINPNSAKVNDLITINGKYFGSSASVGKVYFNSIIASDIVSWSDTKIEVKVPANAQTGFVYVKVNNDESNKVNFTLIDNKPIINSISPTTAKVGDIIKIIGDNFGDNKSNGSIVFTGATATSSDIVSWTNKEIQVKVPVGTLTGDVYVVVNSVKSNTYLFTIDIPKNIPKINSLTPADGIFKINQSVYINGENFGMDKNKVKIELNGFLLPQSSIVNVLNTYINLKIPDGAKSGKLKVIVDGIESNSVDVKIKYYYYTFNNFTSAPAIGIYDRESYESTAKITVEETAITFYESTKPGFTDPFNYTAKFSWNKPKNRFYSHDTSSFNIIGQVLSLTKTKQEYNYVNIAANIYVYRDGSRSMLNEFGISDSKSNGSVSIKYYSLNSLTSTTLAKKIKIAISITTVKQVLGYSYWFYYDYDLNEEFQ